MYSHFFKQMVVGELNTPSPVFTVHSSAYELYHIINITSYYNTILILNK